MKRTIIFWLAALLAVVSLQAQEVKAGHYIIDGKAVKEFDGSQLIGKTITSYTTDQVHNIHIIFTSDYQGDADARKEEVKAALAEVIPVRGKIVVIHDGDAKPKADVDADTKAKLRQIDDDIAAANTELAQLVSQLTGDEFAIKGLEALINKETQL